MICLANNKDLQRQGNLTGVFLYNGITDISKSENVFLLLKQGHVDDE